jgi:hypothetical protein
LKHRKSSTNLSQLLTTTTWSKWTDDLFTLFTGTSFQMVISQRRKPTNCFTSSRDPWPRKSSMVRPLSLKTFGL